ncbi:MAG: AAA family ATPase [Candidatus Dadabacteria bacterium]|nr:AAA family ATPase [Candidatus Dadabacteria bacterium]NIQ13466.1 AAA family ATPase [Candidatus Dadabacteria bacterium]
MIINRDLLHEIEIIIKSRFRLIVLDTNEENRAESLLKLLADYMDIPFFTWTRTQGLKRQDINSKGTVYNSSNASIALDHISSSKFHAIYHFKGFGEYVDDKNIAGKLLDAVQCLAKKDSAIILTGTNIGIPKILKSETTKIKMPAPSIEEYRELLSHIVRDMTFKNNVKVEMTEQETTQLLNNIKGLTLTEAEKILTKIMVIDNKLSKKDIRNVIDAKKDVIEKDGVLEYYPVEESMDNIAGLTTLKKWLGKRKNIITNPDKARGFGLDFPKGILVLGVPGCGKSLCAKAVAMEWELPLLKFDTANLYNKYIGETEKNLNNAINTAEKLAPVILWIDEIEKAFSAVTSEHDGGLSTRIFGTFLSWMQERKGDVFIFATANDVSKLPPEFLRKGRFDEIFFVDLPNGKSRKTIFEIHLKKRGKDINKFDLERFVEISDGFTGSEIEQAIVSGLYTAFSENTDLTTDIIVSEIEETQPLSITMAEKINKLRNWSKERTVNAD